MRRLLRPLWVMLALIFLIEAWLWDRLEPIIARVVDLIPLRSLKDWLAGRVHHLSPGATLIFFGARDSATSAKSIGFVAACT